MCIHHCGIRTKLHLGFVLLLRKPIHFHQPLKSTTKVIAMKFSFFLEHFFLAKEIEYKGKASRILVRKLIRMLIKEEKMQQLKDLLLIAFHENPSKLNHKSKFNSNSANRHGNQ